MLKVMRNNNDTHQIVCQILEYVIGTMLFPYITERRSVVSEFRQKWWSLDKISLGRIFWTISVEINSRSIEIR